MDGSTVTPIPDTDQQGAHPAHTACPHTMQTMANMTIAQVQAPIEDQNVVLRSLWRWICCLQLPWTDCVGLEDGKLERITNRDR